MENYLITFTNEHGLPAGELVTAQASHWNACDHGLNNMPEGATEFEVYSEYEYIRLVGATLDGRPLLPVSDGAVAA
ncbi:hypothetical protein [Mesorhizobium sp. CN2-181]|uniref:hypothetical protein n=1 Tax=Mesorhizobium yinganensis TaxID=3157707 RepID=UPI0032B754E0